MPMAAAFGGPRCFGGCLDREPRRSDFLFGVCTDVLVTAVGIGPCSYG